MTHCTRVFKCFHDFLIWGTQVSMMCCDRRLPADFSSFWRVVDFDCHPGHKNILGDAGDTTSISDAFSIAVVDNTLPCPRCYGGAHPKWCWRLKSHLRLRYIFYRRCWGYHCHVPDVMEWHISYFFYSWCWRCISRISMIYHATSWRYISLSLPRC